MNENNVKKLITTSAKTNLKRFYDESEYLVEEKHYLKKEEASLIKNNTSRENMENIEESKIYKIESNNFKNQMQENRLQLYLKMKIICIPTKVKITSKIT